MKHLDKVDLGSIQVHKKVLAEIVRSAVEEVDGANLITEHLKEKLLNCVGIKYFPGVVIDVDENQDITLEIKVTVSFGRHIPDVARQIQSRVREALDKMADVHVRDVNVNIQGIERGTE